MFQLKAIFVFNVFAKDKIRQRKEGMIILENSFKNTTSITD